MPFKPKVHLGILEHFQRVHLKSGQVIMCQGFLPDQSFENSAAIAVDCPRTYTWTPSQAAHRPRFLPIHVTLY